MADDEDLPLRRDRRRTHDVVYDESIGDDDDSNSRIKVEPDWSDHDDEVKLFNESFCSLEPLLFELNPGPSLNLSTCSSIKSRKAFNEA